jgi:hypothetical protein
MNLGTHCQLQHLAGQLQLLENCRQQAAAVTCMGG